MKRSPLFLILACSIIFAGCKKDEAPVEDCTIKTHLGCTDATGFFISCKVDGQAHTYFQAPMWATDEGCDLEPLAGQQNTTARTEQIIISEGYVQPFQFSINMPTDSATYFDSTGTFTGTALLGTYAMDDASTNTDAGILQIQYYDDCDNKYMSAGNATTTVYYNTITSLAYIGQITTTTHAIKVDGSFNAVIRDENDSENSYQVENGTYSLSLVVPILSY